MLAPPHRAAGQIPSILTCVPKGSRDQSKVHSRLVWRRQTMAIKVSSRIFAYISRFLQFIFCSLSLGDSEEVECQKEEIEALTIRNERLQRHVTAMKKEKHLPQQLEDLTNAYLRSPIVGITYRTPNPRKRKRSFTPRHRERRQRARHSEYNIDPETQHQRAERARARKHRRQEQQRTNEGRGQRPRAAVDTHTRSRTERFNRGLKAMQSTRSRRWRWRSCRLFGDIFFAALVTWDRRFWDAHQNMFACILRSTEE